jgi:catalase
MPPLPTQRLSEKEQERLGNLGKNGPRDVTGKTMTHCVPNKHVRVT